MSVSLHLATPSLHRTHTGYLNEPYTASNEALATGTLEPNKYLKPSDFVNAHTPNVYLSIISLKVNLQSTSDSMSMTLRTTPQLRARNHKTRHQSRSHGHCFTFPRTKVPMDH